MGNLERIVPHDERCVRKDEMVAMRWAFCRVFLAKILSDRVALVDLQAFVVDGVMRPHATTGRVDGWGWMDDGDG